MRDCLFFDGKSQGFAKGKAEGDPKEQDLTEFQQGGERKILVALHGNELEDQHRDQGPNGIDKDALPFQDGRQVPLQGEVAQDRGDHRGAGHHNQSGKQKGDRPGKPDNIMGGRPSDQQGHHHAQTDQFCDHRSHAPDLGASQGQPPLKEDHTDGQGHKIVQALTGKKAFFPVPDGLDQLGAILRKERGYGAYNDPDQYQGQDGGQFELPGHPLGNNAQYDNSGNLQHQVNFSEKYS